PPSPQLARLHRRDATLRGALSELAVLVEHEQGVPAPVHARDHGALGVGVLGTQLRARSRPTTAGPVADLALVEAAGSHRPSIPSHCSVKSGRVFEVVATFSTTTPGTRRPMIAPAVAMRL